MVMLRASWLIGLVGCAQLFGIANTTGPGGGGSDGSAGGPASLRVVRLSVGAKLVSAPQDLAGQTATYVIRDASAAGGLRRVSATLTGTDTWTADIPDTAPAIEFTLPDYPTPYPRIYALPSRQLVGLYTRFEHPNATPPPQGAQITISVTPNGPQPGDSYALLSVGTWMSYGLAAPNGTTGQLQETFAYDQPGASITGVVAKITQSDVVLVMRHTGNALTGFYRAQAFDQTGNDTITGSMQGNPANQMVSAMTHPELVGPRLANVRPMVGNLSMAAYLHAAPAAMYANNLGVLLNGGPVQPTDTGKLSGPFGNPFVADGWNSILTWTTSESRTYTPPSMNLPVTLAAGMNQFADPAAGLDLTLPAGLPTTISVDQRPLLSDGMTVTIDPTRAVDLSFVPDQPGATLYQIQLYELVPNAQGTALQYQARLSTTCIMPEVTVPPDVFQVGHVYTLRAISRVGGYPALSTGDLTNRTLPLAESYADSGVFTVAAP